MPVKAFIFDFDGLILDSETPVYDAWKEIYQEHGVDLPFSIWQCTVGTSRDAFDPVLYLEEQIGRPLNRKQLNQRQIIRSYEIIQYKDALPGVISFLDEAHKRGIKLAVASSSTTDWVFCNLVRLNIADRFDVICCGDEVMKVKPEPDLFLLAAGLLNLAPDEVIVFEDSPLGITAARTAHMYCVAVPNPVTHSMSINHADLVINSLAELSMDNLLEQFEHRSRR
jgi:HAD superfamily hydrolase (TIGR01509 family)